MKIIITESQFLLLLESTTRGEVYHFTYAIDGILKSNSMNLSSSISTNADSYGSKPFFLSLSRTGSPKLGWGKKGRIFRIVLDGNKLNNNFKSIPLDYWGTKGNYEYRDSDSFEFEDRILSDKPVIDNISNFIIRIDTVVDDIQDEYNSMVYQLSKDRGIPIYFYSSGEDMMKGKNNINNLISSTHGPFEKPYESKGSSYNRVMFNLLALFLYDVKDLDNMDNFCLRLSEVIRKNNLPDFNCYEIYDRMRSMYYGGIGDKVNSINADIHTYFKQGVGGDLRKWILIITKDMKKLGVTSIADYARIKVDGVKPKLTNFKYSEIYCLYELDYNMKTESYDQWLKVDNDSKMDEISGLYFNVQKYGGQLTDEDWNYLYNESDRKLYVGEWIDYFMNRYTIDKAKDIIHKTGYSNYSKIYKFKLDKK